MSPPDGRDQGAKRRDSKARGEVGSSRSSEEGSERSQSEGSDGSGKVQHTQLTFAFIETPQGAGSGKTPGQPDVRKILGSIAKGRTKTGWTTTTADRGRLMEEVASAPNLAQALLNVAANKGAPGMDGKSVEEVVADSRRLLPKLQAELLKGTYRPGDIRRVWIPKPGGGQRGLGIPNVIDRWVQQAVFQVLDPIFDPTFDESSHGFRLGRGVQTAIAEAKAYVESGLCVIVDMDISKFFDHVNHQRLLARLGRQIADRRILDLVNLMLKARVVMPDGTRVSTQEGTPQGGPLSPLLSNIVLDELDQELKRRKLRFVRYADDCNIFVHTERAGARVLESVGRFLEKRLRLELNAEKSAVRRPEETHFLGFCFRIVEGGKALTGLAERSKKRLATKIRALTPRTFGASLQACFDACRSYLKGWFAYFGICEGEVTERELKGFDAHVRRRIRAIIVRQKKRSAHLFRYLLQRGVEARHAKRSAFGRRGAWYVSHTYGMERAHPNSWFHDRLFSLLNAWKMKHAPPEHPRLASGQLLLFPI